MNFLTRELIIKIDVSRSHVTKSHNVFYPRFKLENRISTHLAT